MFLPKPFSKAVMMRGDLISIPAKLSPEEFKYYSEVVERALKEVTAAANKIAEDLYSKPSDSKLDADT